MMKQLSFLLFAGLLIFTTQCNQGSSNQTKKSQVQNELTGKISLPGQTTDESVREKVDKSLVLIKESKKLVKENNQLLTDLKAKIKENADKIAKLEKRVEQVEKNKVNKRSKKLRKKLVRKIKRQNVLVRRYCRDEYYVPVKTLRRGNYKVYVGAFKVYSNAQARRSGVSKLGLPVTIIDTKKTGVRSRPKKVKESYRVEEYLESSSSDIADATYFDNEKAYVETVPEYEYKYVQTAPRNLYKVVSTQGLSYNDAVKWTNYLLSRGFEAYISRG